MTFSLQLYWRRGQVGGRDDDVVNELNLSRCQQTVSKVGRVGTKGIYTLYGNNLWKVSTEMFLRCLLLESGARNGGRS